MDVTEHIFEFAQQTPDARALVHDLEPTSYRAFHRAITAMRHKLETCELTPGGTAVVWIYSTRLSWIVNLALRTLGMTTVAIRSPAEFEGFAGLEVVALITSGEENYPALGLGMGPDVKRIVVQSADWNPPDDGGPLEPPPPGPRGDHMLLTSGTTGSYKMMRVNAAGSSARIDSGIERFRERATSEQRQARRASNILNLGLWTLVGYSTPIVLWTVGATVITHQGPDAYRSFAVPGITSASVTPASLAQILPSIPPTFARNDNLRLSVTGGSLSRQLAAQIRSKLTNSIIIALGSTESGGWAVTEVKTDEDLIWHRLLPTRTVEVVDEHDEPLPPGRLGLVRVLLTNDFTGYVNAPEATAAHLKGGYFYPGDLGVLDGAGRIALHGRVTDVVNVMGDKVATGPYERALQDDLGLEGVCLLSEPGDDREEQLHVVLEAPEPIDEERLREAARKHLRGFPAARFHFLASFPRNHMGKVERFKLRQRLIEQQQAQARIAAT